MKFLNNDYDTISFDYFVIISIFLIFLKTTMCTLKIRFESVIKAKTAN